MPALVRRVVAAFVVAVFSVAGARADGVIVGVNTVDVGKMAAAQQAALLTQLRANGVTTIRLDWSGNADAFIIAAYRQGIGADVIVPITGPAGDLRAADPAQDLTWRVLPLSAASPAQLQAYITAQLGPLEAAGVHLTAFELGNEINNPQFNGDFTDPGTGRLLTLTELQSPQDAETRAIALGLRNYLRLLAVLKKLRDASASNAATPILSAGLADPGLARPASGSGLDWAGIGATLGFLRQNGLDALVDGYGVHVYPRPGTTITVAARIKALQEDTFSACQAGGKPCWLTEWGFNNPGKACPLNDTARLAMVKTMRNAYRYFSGQGRLAAVIYYSWAGHAGVAQSQEAIYRCGGLTPAGRLALSAF